MQADNAISIGGIAVIVFLLLLGFAFWITPVFLGIRLAQKKGYSPHWMWFGVNPVGAWAAMIVMAALEKRNQCPNCGGFIASNFRICPYCRETVPASVQKIVEPQYLE